MPNKRHSRLSIMTFELCDFTTGYVVHVELFAGKDFPNHSDMGQAHGVVMDLMRKVNLLKKGYQYSPTIFTLLKEKTLLTEIVRTNSKGLPPLVTKMNVGQIVNYRRQGVLLDAFPAETSADAEHSSVS